MRYHSHDGQRRLIRKLLESKSDPSFDRSGRSKTATPKMTVSGGNGKMHIELAASNPLFPGSPDIDTKLDVSVQMNSDMAYYSGYLFGDAFPDSEAFIINSQKQPLSLITFHTTGDPNTGPIHFLSGNNNRDMGSFKSKCISQ